MVLTTAYSEFALEGFENEALDYLLKPIAFDRFLKAAQRALNNTTITAPDWQPIEREDEYMFVKTETKGKMLKVDFKDLIYVEGLKNYVSLFTAEEPNNHLHQHQSAGRTASVLLYAGAQIVYCIA